MTEKPFGCLGVVDAERPACRASSPTAICAGIWATTLLSRRVGEIMTANPKTVRPDTLAAPRWKCINASKITALFVVEDGRPPVGIIHIHDLLRAGVA